VFDLPTALYVSAVEIEGSTVLGQFPAQDGVAADEFGLVFDKDNALATCVNTALATLKENGTLAAITAEWLSTSTNIPVIE
jgi:polar amino acid transport system substrate-binding protein